MARMKPTAEQQPPAARCRVSELTPVPKGMCPAFYQFMGAGSPRSDSGEILMLRTPTTNTKGMMMSDRTEGNKVMDLNTEAATVLKNLNGDFDKISKYVVDRCGDFTRDSERAAFIAAFLKPATPTPDAKLVAAAREAVKALRQLTREGVRVIDLDNDLIADALAAALAERGRV